MVDRLSTSTSRFDVCSSARKVKGYLGIALASEFSCLFLMNLNASKIEKDSGNLKLYTHTEGRGREYYRLFICWLEFLACVAVSKTVSILGSS